MQARNVRRDDATVALGVCHGMGAEDGDTDVGHGRLFLFGSRRGIHVLTHDMRAAAGWARNVAACIEGVGRLRRELIRSGRDLRIGWRQVLRLRGRSRGSRARSYGRFGERRLLSGLGPGRMLPEIPRAESDADDKKCGARGDQETLTGS